jgi:TolB protein
MALPAVGAHGAEAAIGPIVYDAPSGDGGHDTELFTVRSDGSHRRRLTHGALDDSHPSWSPDRRWIVFRRLPTCEALCGPGDFDRPLYIIRADGTHLHALPHTSGAGDPSWSPTGRRIAFVDATSRGAAIFTIRPDGTHRRRITPRGGQPSGPDWSPDGRSIAFQTAPNGIATVDVRDGRRRIVAGLGRDPSWAPNGRHIAFAGSHHYADGTVGEIYTVRPDGSHRRRVTFSRPHSLCHEGFECTRFDEDPVWSPGGRRIAFAERTDSSPAAIFTVRPDGSGARRVTKRGAEPDW